MAGKRAKDDNADASPANKPRAAFKVGPDNLPDGTWRRKVVKIKKNLVHKAKIKRSYAKLKARELPVNKAILIEELDSKKPVIIEPFLELHPERQAMLDNPRVSTPPPVQNARSLSARKHSHKPAYFEKERAFAEKQKAEAEARRLEVERRREERDQKNAERERIRKAMAKARAGGQNGQRKLGKESQVLLERVKRIVAS